MSFKKRVFLAFSISVILFSPEIKINQAKADIYIKPCEDRIFCTGEILRIIQLARPFKDSKTFVDMPLRIDRNETEEILRKRLKGKKSSKKIREIVEMFFSTTGTEMEKFTPPDWKPTPRFLLKIKDTEYYLFARNIHKIWKKLARKIASKVSDNPSQYTLIYSSHPFVVPGGRFREFYYWDTYWVVKGLLLSEMTDTVKNILLNFIDLIKRYGIIPNGGRKYYINRSQPPFMTLMVKEYYERTKDVDFVRDNIDYLEKEYLFWMNNRTVLIGKDHGLSSTLNLNLYSTPMGFPRPESYWQDIETMKEAGLAKKAQDQKELYSHISSAAESGWDFSSRWFNFSKPGGLRLSSIRTRKIIPVDLNSILCAVERTLAEFWNLIGNQTKHREYKQAFEKRKRAIETLFWDKGFKQWLDYDIEHKMRRRHFYVSNIFPLWARCHDATPARVEAVIDSLKAMGLFDFKAGIPTSLIHSEQQWDYPNAWPPLQDVVEEALRESGSARGKKLAFELAKKWLETNYISWEETGHMYEKYDVNIKGKPGHGGEYDVQEGFGWTNGVVLKFLDLYGNRLNAPYMPCRNKWTVLLLILTLLVFCFFVRFNLL